MAKYNIYIYKNVPQPNKLNLHLNSELLFELGALREPSPVGSFIHLVRKGDLLVVERGEEADFV